MQVGVAHPAPVLDRLSGRGPLLAFLTAPPQGGAAKAEVKGHADAVEAPGQLVSGGS